MTKQSDVELPPIPAKRYFSIGEAAALCGVKAHVLRYWEQEFPALSPAKRRGNRRYYQLSDILLARQIRQLLYGEGFTIQGARERVLHLAAEQDRAERQALSMNAIKTEIRAILQLCRYGEA